MQSPRTVKVFAPAKVNLALHITGRREDGYHLLDSLVGFASVGDWLLIEPSDELKLRVVGPMADYVPKGDDNLIFKAAATIGQGRGAAITLDKYLPVAGGIGGGSADAGAAIRGLWLHWQLPPPGGDIAPGLVALGADVPVCVMSAPARMQGIGEKVSHLKDFPEAWIVLANPGVSLATRDVFRALKRRENPPMPPALPHFADVRALGAFLREQRNDLEPEVEAKVPAVARALSVLRAARGAVCARMSGSGATCFALFEREDQARATMEVMRRPGWWLGGGRLYADARAALPEFVS